MDAYVLTFRVEGLNDAAVDALHSQNYSDVITSEIDGVCRIIIEQEAPSVLAAVVSCTRALERYAPDVALICLEPEYVTSGEIAQRLGLSREAVRLYADGQRGNGDFPRPAFTMADKTRVWDWSDVNAWAQSSLGRGDDEVYLDRDTVDIVNGILAEQRRDPTMDVHVHIARRLAHVTVGQQPLRGARHSHTGGNGHFGLGIKLLGDVIRRQEWSWPTDPDGHTVH